MSHRLLVLDVDGTLLRRDGTIHPDDHAAIAGLRARGVPVSIATGRLYSGTRGVARSIALTGPIACVDGSHIVGLEDDGELVSHAITGADALALRSIVARSGAASFLFAQDSIVHDSAGLPFAGYVKTWSPNIAYVDRALDHENWEHAAGVMAVVAIGGEAEIKAAVSSIEGELGHAARTVIFPVSRIERYAMVIRAAGPTKGTAIAWLAKHHGLTPADVVVVGDWINDVPMFEVAGRSFAMGQAPAEVKAKATDHLEADGHEGGGVAEAIRRAWG